ncbi:MAG: alpha/beta hydrolase [Silicimonas sp.]|nr:alpha/beta hydrolase [Silicimonas sp.]
MDMDRAYNNADFIPGGADNPDRWLADGRAFRETEAAVGRARLNVSYGGGARQKLDLFHPSGKAAGLVVFVHGGYWMKFDRAYWSHLARGLTARGWAVAMPSYTLAPEARVHEITREIARAIEAAAPLVAGPIRLAGHSAGGHLAARMGCRDVVLNDEVRARLKRIVPISPIGDLRPLLQTALNDTLGMDMDEAEAESPALHAAPDVPVTVWVGAEERPVFLDQARWLAEAWGAVHRIDPGRHHFDVIDGLEMADSPLVAAILD